MIKKSTNHYVLMSLRELHAQSKKPTVRAILAMVNDLQTQDGIPEEHVTKSTNTIFYHLNKLCEQDLAQQLSGTYYPIKQETP